MQKKPDIQNNKDIDDFISGAKDTQIKEEAKEQDKKPAPTEKKTTKSGKESAPAKEKNSEAEKDDAIDSSILELLGVVPDVEDKRQTTIYFEKSVIDAVDQIAKKCHMSRSEFVNFVMKKTVKTAK